MTHADLVDHAASIFGCQLVAEIAYDTWRRNLFALYKQEWGHLSQVDRLHEGLRNVYRMRATSGHPWWEAVGAEIEAALERMVP